MAENPSQSPKPVAPSETPKNPAALDPIAWAVIGFAIGTLLIAPFVLSMDLRDQITGGMMFGGLFGAIYGFAHGLERRRKARAAMMRRDDWDTPINPRRFSPAQPRR